MSGLTYSFDYNVGTQRKTGAVVLLCSDSPIGIINSRPPHTVSQFRENDIRTFTIDYFRNFMSVKVLHEFIHAADINWCKTNLPPYLYLKYFYMHNLTWFSLLTVLILAGPQLYPEVASRLKKKENQVDRKSVV